MPPEQGRRRILVPLDGRRAAETALPAAVKTAGGSGASLYLLHVLAAAAAPVRLSPRHREAVQKAERYLAATRQRIAPEVDGVNTAVWAGSPAAAIVKAADLIDADLIVIARSGRTGPPRTLVGSVVERVLRGTKRPVLVVTPAEAAVDLRLGDAAPLPDREATEPTIPGTIPSAAPAGRRSRPGHAPPRTPTGGSRRRSP